MTADPQQDSSNLRNDSEDFRTVPQDSETFREVPKDSEAFRTVPNDAEARESHTLTVKEVARMFEEAGVARTERSVINWCQKDPNGSSRLDSYFDPNERKHFITPESADRAIKEELAKVGLGANSTAPATSLRTDQDPGTGTANAIDELRQEVLDLKITNKGKDYIIKQLREERAELFAEQRALVDRVETANQNVGRLEERLLRLSAPTNDQGGAEPPSRTDP